MKKRILYSVIFLIALFQSKGTRAQNSFVGNMTPVVSVQPVVALSLTQNANTNVTFATSAAYSNGLAVGNFCTLGVKANMPWLVSVNAQSSFFTPASTGADNNMPCGVISLRQAGTTTYFPLRTTSTTLKTGTQGAETANGNRFGVDMLFTPGYTYNPGIYNLSLTYTVTNQ